MIVVIGDIHGCIRSLESLLKRIPGNAEIFSTGDLIDRGPASMEVVSLCMEAGIRPVMGNHEHMLLDYLDGTGIYGCGVYFMNGGMKTLSSYGGSLSDKHIDFISSLPLYIETKHFILSHAGIHHMKSLNEACSLEKDMELNILWNRGGLRDIGKPQVIGHTPHSDVAELESGSRTVGINIDTGCVYPYFGRLTAVSFPGGDYFQVECEDQVDSITHID